MNKTNFYFFAKGVLVEDGDCCRYLHVIFYFYNNKKHMKATYVTVKVSTTHMEQKVTLG